MPSCLPAGSRKTNRFRGPVIGSSIVSASLCSTKWKVTCFVTGFPPGCSPEPVAGDPVGPLLLLWKAPSATSCSLNVIDYGYALSFFVSLFSYVRATGSRLPSSNSLVQISIKLALASCMPPSFVGVKSPLRRLTCLIMSLYSMLRRTRVGSVFPRGYDIRNLKL